ncbi:MAG: hypothetical protein EAX87_00860 [Candidatus Thorarchaeota archaeon]|nr:hypothetical protein [Candidatus Thorarchaeota archaeon]
MSPTDIFSILKRSKFDLLILIVVLVLFYSNQLAYGPLRATGTIRVTEGDAIPQESNYTLSTEFSLSVKSAVLFNYTLNELDGVTFYTSADGVSRFVYNITLQSTENDTDVNIRTYLGYYSSSHQVVVGHAPTVFSVEPTMSVINEHPDYWIPFCGVIFESNITLEFRNVLLWAEFDTPVSPVNLNWQTTNGYPLFENPYTMWMNHFRPQIRFERQSGGAYGDFGAFYQNRTLYLKPSNYTMEVSWGDEVPSIPIFYLTVSENYSTTCILNMKTVRLSLSKQNTIPLIHLEIKTDFIEYGFYNQYLVYDLYLYDSEFPEYLFLPPPYQYYIIDVYSMDPLSKTLRYEPHDVGVYTFKFIEANGSHNINAEISMSYLYFFDFIITPLNFYQLSLTAFLILCIILRVYRYSKTKEPEISWRKPLLVPVVLIGFTVFIPWFFSVRELVEASYGFNTTIQVVAFGPIPLVASWTDSGWILLEVPQGAFYWTLLSLALFWCPLLFSSYFLSSPDLSDTYPLFLILPLGFLDLIQIAPTVLYTFPFTLNWAILILLLLATAIAICGYIVLRLTGRLRSKNKREVDISLRDVSQ